MKILNYIYRIMSNKASISGIIFVTVCWISTFPAQAEKISLKESAHQHIIKMKTGDNLEIILEGNPTTGYIWEKVEGDNTVLSLQGNYKFTPARQLAGSGGKFVFTFLGAAPGKTKLHLIYHRTFEKGAVPAKSFAIIVIVQ
jgi:predicted secreted protein